MKLNQALLENVESMKARDPGTESNLVANALLSRAALVTKMLDPRRDIDDEAGYPTDITNEQYRRLWEREGIARRIVKCFPDESWALSPVIFETEDPKKTQFETAFDELEKRLNFFHYLHRIDILSGIGRYGVLLIGFDDGGKLDEPVEGINARGEQEGQPKERKVIFLRAFDERLATVDSRETDLTNPRFGHPTFYTLRFKDMEEGNTGGAAGAASGATGAVTTISHRVHWSRVIHVADNRETSEVFGVPRLQSTFNRNLDLRKIYAGAGEMFWKGGFPGYAFEVDGSSDLDTDTLRSQLELYQHGLQRYLALQGVTVTSLDVQVANPKAHVEINLDAIAITLGVPKRKFIGSEQAQLASEQDERTWNKRVSRRQEQYVTPLLIRPTVDRLIAVGALPAPSEENGYTVNWPDLNTTTDEDRAKVAERVTKALAQYVSLGVDQLFPPAEYLSMIHGFSPEEVATVITAAAGFQEESGSEEEVDGNGNGDDEGGTSHEDDEDDDQ